MSGISPALRKSFSCAAELPHGAEDAPLQTDTGNGIVLRNTSPGDRSRVLE